MNCRDFLIEFEERKPLSKMAAAHLNNCPGCKKSSSEQTIVWQMIDCLKEVDAPKDFDFRLKARIAKAKPGDFQSRFLPALRYVLPLSLVVLIFAFVAFNGVSFIGNNVTPQTAENLPPKQIEKEILPQQNPLTNEIADAGNRKDSPEKNPLVENSNFGSVKSTDKNARKTSDGNIQFVAIKSSKSSPAATPKSIVKDGFVGSRDSASTSPKAIAPKGFDSNKSILNSPNLGNNNSIKAEDIFTTLGMETVSENGNQRVKAIKQKSIAERSGVKVGDVIEAIDGKKITDETSGKAIEGKTLTIRRGAEKIEITLKN